uniref:Uncharacterized protein n=1 Tax=Aegilops tauschii TaxID=37682 RepID=R7WGI2_AEGTA
MGTPWTSLCFLPLLCRQSLFSNFICSSSIHGYGATANFLLQFLPLSRCLLACLTLHKRKTWMDGWVDTCISSLVSSTDWFLLNPCAEDMYKNLKKNDSGGQEPEATGVTPAVYGGDHKLSVNSICLLCDGLGLFYGDVDMLSDLKLLICGLVSYYGLIFFVLTLSLVQGKL